MKNLLDKEILTFDLKAIRLYSGSSRYYGDLMEIVRMDKQGRILIPASVRKKLGTNLFSLEVVENELRLKPIKIIRLSDLFDSIEVDAKDFSDTHELRRALLE